MTAHLLWSVIVITRNEGRWIRQCLESVFDALGSNNNEILLIDSGSTDDTIRIAQEYPIRILCLAKSAPLHPAAGRHVGYKYSIGELMLFLDGDSVLHREWISTALEAFTEPNLAGFSGARQEILVGPEGQQISCRDRYAERASENVSAMYLGGPAAYRRTVFDRVGGFNPFMYVQEEQELGARIRAAGFALKRSEVRMTTHFVTSEPESFTGLWRRVLRRYPLGMGQLVRYGLKHHCLSSFQFQDIRRHIQFWILITCGVLATLIWKISGYGGPAIAWLLISFFAFLFFCWRARGIVKPLYFVVEWFVFGAMALCGFLLSPRPAAEYPLQSWQSIL